MENIEIDQDRYEGLCGFSINRNCQRLEEVNEQLRYKQQAKFIKESIPVEAFKLPSRDIQLKLFPLESYLYEDNSILENKKCLNYKLNRFHFKVDDDGSIVAFAFTYLDLDTGEQICGKNMGAQRYLPFGQKSFKLELDEFAIGVQYNTGRSFNHLGFITSKGRVVGYKNQIAPISYKLPIGYHIGAISSSLSRNLQGIQFDCKLIPKQFRKKMEFEMKDKNKSKFLFFQNEKLFSYAIEFLSCRDVMRLFLVSKTVAEFRKTCEAYWLKCWNQCDKLMLAYLRGIASLYGIKDLIQLLGKHRWNDIPLIADKPESGSVRLKFDSDAFVKNMTEGVSYLIVVGAVYVTGNVRYQQTVPYNLILFEKQLEIFRVSEQILKPENALQIRKISILLKWSPEAFAELSTWAFVVNKTCKQCYAISTISSVSAISKHFSKYKNGICIHSGRGPILKE